MWAEGIAYALSGPFGLDWSLFLLIMGAVFLVLALWTFRDASRRGMNGTMWFLAVLLTGLIAFAPYVILRVRQELRARAA